MLLLFAILFYPLANTWFFTFIAYAAYYVGVPLGLAAAGRVMMLFRR